MRGRSGWKKDKATVKSVVMNCPYCNKEFIVKPSVMKKSKLNFCSSKCNVEYYKHTTAEKRKTGEYVECTMCGKLHYRPQNKLKKGRMHFCSIECSNQYASTINKAGENSPRYTSVKVKCSYCEKEITRTPSLIKKYTNHFCDVKCMGEYYKTSLNKENNPNWKGGYNIKGYGPHWKEISLQIRERDNFTCQRCGAHLNDLPKNHKLDVHHIVPLREFNGDHESANQYSNLITLCSTCHMVVEHE